MNIFSILPQMGALKQRVLLFERELKKDFGAKIKLDIHEIDIVYGIDMIVKMVSDLLSAPMHEMLSNKRQANAKEARQIAMYLCRKYIPDVKDREIAAYFSRDRSNVIHSINRINMLIDAKDTVITENIHLCESYLQSRIQNSLSDSTNKSQTI